MLQQDHLNLNKIQQYMPKTDPGIRANTIYRITQTLTHSVFLLSWPEDVHEQLKWDY